MRYTFKIIILFLFFKFNLFSQNFSFFSYGNKDGFLSQEAMCVFTDSRGYLWIGGIDGLTRYDGQKFTNYNKSNNGLIDNEIQGISEDKKHNLWITTTIGISYFDGLAFTNYSYQITDKAFKKPYFINVHEVSNGDVYANAATGIYKLDKQTRTFIQLSDIKTYVSDIKESRDGTIWISVSLGLYKLKNNVFTKIDLEPIIGYNTATCLSFDYHHNLWIGTTQGILKYDGKKFTHFFTELTNANNIKDIVLSKDSSLIFVSEAPELKIFKSGNFKILNISKEIGNVPVQHIVTDNNGNYWMAAVSLVKMGVKPFQKHYLSDTINATINAIASLKNTLYIGTNKGLKTISNNKISTVFPSKKIYGDEHITCLNICDSLVLAGTINGNIFKIVNNKCIYIDSLSANNQAYSILPIHENEFWFCKKNLVTHYLNGDKFNYSLSSPISVFTQNAMRDNNTVWFANLENLTVYKNEIFKKITAEDGFNFQAPVTLNMDLNKYVWIGTYGSGLVKFDRQMFQNVSTKNGLVNDFVSSTYYDDEKNKLWVGTSNGVSEIFLDANSNIKFIQNYKTQNNDFELNCNTNSICKLPNGKIVFGCENNLVEFNSTAYPKKGTQNSNLYFDGLKLFNQSIDWKTYADSISTWDKMPVNLELPHDKNYLTFDFVAVDFNNSENIKYQWMLENSDLDWSPESYVNSITLSNIAPGSYTLYVRAFKNLNEQTIPIQFSFTIRSPFYQTLWFIFLVISIGISLIILWMRIKINQVKKQESIKSENHVNLMRSELKAMKAQMNPHFMFNTLNSIQDIVLNRDDKSARIYLADFAKLMRLILENSDQKSITLEKEIDFLSLYISLEKLRFDDKFNLELYVSEELTIHEIQLVPMLIQPYVENAIIHGLMHKTEKGLLTISFNLISQNNQNFLECIILDNGIGRKKSGELNAWKRKAHQSLGTQITNERIAILNLISESKGYQVIVKDLHDSFNNPLGTQIIIHLPLTYTL